MKRATAIGLGAALLGVAVACGTQRDVSAGADCTTGFCDQGPGTAAFGDAALPDGEAGTTASMCPIAKCEPGHATCANSTFPCDVDFSRDPSNCGACGVQCPAPLGQVKGDGACVDGRCTVSCWEGHMECDGLPDTGCETSITTDENCGGCGIKCGADEDCLAGKCEGCSPGTTSCKGLCVDLNRDDYNCGACDNVCLTQIPSNYVERPNMYFGCAAAACQTRCFDYHGDCNNKILDGCEVNFNELNDEHCGACGIKCVAPEKCRFDPNHKPLCGCEPGLVNCSPEPDFRLACVDLTNDPINCGGCNIVCPGGKCVAGVCEVACPPNMADCNGSAVDRCEKNLASDPENCGACGHVCSGAPGQPCIAGHCAVEECGGPK